MNLFENLQNLHKMEEEVTQLKPLSGSDIWAWQGANDFADGSAPMIAEGTYATIIVSGSDEKDGIAIVSIYYGMYEDSWGFKNYKSKEEAIKAANELLYLINTEFDERELTDKGFTLV